MSDQNLIALADSFMAIFGFKRKAIVSGNVIEPVFERQCGVCGDSHRSDEVPYACETGNDV